MTWHETNIGDGRRPTPGLSTALWLAMLLLLYLADAAMAAPQTFNTALPVAQGEFVFREQVVLDQSGNDPAGTDRDRTVLSAISVLGYGATKDLALFGVVPMSENRLELTESGSRRARSARGLGDVQVFARYTAFKDDRKGQTFRVAPFGGIEIPTGDDDVRDSFGSLPNSVQLGSGSWDPFAGIVASFQTLDFQIDVQASYKMNPEANDFEFGDEARLDASFQYRLWPRKLGSGIPGFLYGTFEANLIHQGKNKNAGTEDANSNGTRLFLVPGLQYVTKRWIAEAAVQLPVYRNLNGTALEKDYIVRAGFRVNF